MNYSEIISKEYGIEVSFPLDEQIHRFGKKKEIWAIGREWTYKGNQYWSVNYGNYKNPMEPSKGKLITSWDGRELDVNEKRSIKNHLNTLEVKARLEKEKKYKTCADVYRAIFSRLPPPNEIHPYLTAKQIDKSFGTYVADFDDPDNHIYNGTLLIPIYNEKKEIAGGQRIYKSDGSFHKRYSPGVQLIGSYFAFGDWENAELIYLAEGFSTGATIHQATQKPVVICFQAGNISETLFTIRHHNPKSKVVICADRDADKKGEICALKAYKKFNNVVVKLVQFPEGSPQSWSDFNDLACYVDIKEVKKQLTVSLKNFENEQFRKDIEEGFTLRDDNDRIIYNYDRLLQFFHSKTKYFYVVQNKMVYAYQDNHYKIMEDDEIRGFAEKFFFPKPKKNQRNEFLSKVQANHQEQIDIIKHTNKPLINFKNCVLDYSTKTTHPNSPDFNFTYVIEHDYDPEAKAPVWNQMLKNLLRNNYPLIDQLHQFMGFIISAMDHSKFQKFAIFYGEGENGKTTVIDTISAIIGQKNTSALAMENVKERFATTQMEYSLMNVCEEEHKRSFKESGPIKKLTGNTPMTVEHKNKPAYSFKNRSKIVCTFNDLPEFLDSSHGMYRRLLLFLFGVNLKLEPDKKIDNIHEKLEKEYSGIINEAIEGLYSLLKNGDFVNTSDHNSLLEEIKRESDPIYDFYKSRIQITQDERDFTASTTIYTEFKNFFGESRLSYSERYFYKRFSKMMAGSRSKKITKKTSGNKAIKGYSHLQLIQTL